MATYYTLAKTTKIFIYDFNYNDGKSIFSRFNSLENEVRKRDEIISQLQKRIQELERLGLPGMSLLSTPNDDDQEVFLPDEVVVKHISKNGSSGSDDASCIEEGFMVSLYRLGF